MKRRPLASRGASVHAAHLRMKMRGANILLRAMDPRTGRMKEVDRIIEATVEDALKKQAEWRDEIRRGAHVAAEVPCLIDDATSWLRSQLG